nr:hypothetical protein [Tanacetum cinerariifolium]
AFRVFNSRTRILQETLHVNFMENKPNVAGSGPAWLFDIDSLTRTINYHPVIVENQTNFNAGFQDKEKAGEEGTQTYVLFPVGAQSRKQDGKTKNKDKGKSSVVTITGFRDLNAEFKECTNNNSNEVNAASSLVSTIRHNFINSTNDFSAAGPSNAAMLNVEDLSHSNYADDVGAEADINNLESIISVSPIPTTRIHKDHSTSQIIGDLSLTTQTSSMARAVRYQESIEQFPHNFANQPNETNMNHLESNDESVDIPLVSPFPHSDNDSDDSEVLKELIEYKNVGMLRREREINSFDGDDLTFQCMIGFRKFVAYFDPFLPMNISRIKPITLQW